MNLLASHALTKWSDGDAANIVNKAVFEHAAAALGLDKKELEKCLLWKTMVVARGIAATVDAAIAAVDSYKSATGARCAGHIDGRP